MATEGSLETLKAKPVDQLLAVRWDLGSTLELAGSADAAPLATIRALYSGPVFGLVRCDAGCVGALHPLLPNGAERSHLEQRILRATETERFDGIAIDASGLDEIDAPASAFIEELAAAVHSDRRTIAVVVRMTCRDVLCNGVRLLGRIARAADVVILEELDEDVPDEATRTDRRHRVIQESLGTPGKGPTARVFLDSERAREEAKALGLGGVYVGLLTSSLAPEGP
jgi:hypothetical protein